MISMVVCDSVRSRTILEARGCLPECPASIRVWAFPAILVVRSVDLVRRFVYAK